MKIKTSFILISLLVLSSCSTYQERTKFSDKSLRLLIDPTSIDVRNFVRLQTAMVKTNAFTVIDRGAGYRATRREQDRIHKYHSNRFSDREKFAHFGKLYSVGTIIVAHTQCTYAKSFWKSRAINKCYQAINMVDSTSGEVVLSVEDVNTAPMREIPDWHRIVDKLLDVYPKYFTPSKITERLERYKQESKEHSLRVRSIMAD